MKTLRSVSALVLVALGLNLPLSVKAAHAEEGFKSLFNGKDLTGWEGRPEHCSVKDEALTGISTKEHPAEGNNFLIWRGGPVDDFELRFSYRIIGGNSGIQYRSVERKNFVVA